jgi:hypothetical protein
VPGALAQTCARRRRRVEQGADPVVRREPRAHRLRDARIARHRVREALDVRGHRRERRADVLLGTTRRDRVSGAEAHQLEGAANQQHEHGGRGAAGDNARDADAPRPRQRGTAIRRRDHFAYSAGCAALSSGSIIRRNPRDPRPASLRRIHDV